MFTQLLNHIFSPLYFDCFIEQCKVSAQSWYGELVVVRQTPAGPQAVPAIKRGGALSGSKAAF